MRTANYTDLRSNLKHYLDSVVSDSEPLLVYRPGNHSVVVIPLDEYNAIRETAHLASSPAMMERLRSAESNMRAGEGVPVDPDML
jgi:antitoxin YefM